ncbi:ImmA/IrrE family metallo-endopeptidase [Bifidobacterium sp. SO1]|uniref:ImmA/IrrE family metallo-endopeptidase n=1 Tax=Bifidobacterium sp. SO1 TaxID=2809029 RepID=UPI001BDC7F1F|nr:ImmA/IrrE family metallo-endopeptidase [Bifidobacterium sp. SO1]MBT1162950.1 ImmA/IrrE family metallo-endopeptidase [Bifidobacterium sp. SO1]
MGYVWQDARREAQSILDEYWDQQTLPIDIERLCRLENVNPIREQLPDGLSGMLIKKKNEREARAYVDELEPRVRRRFTFAHELGHYIERTRLADDHEFGFSEIREIRRNGRRDDYFPHEFFADEFAGALLMPESKIREFLDENMTVEQMAEKFDVSVSAMKQRLRSLEKTNA